MHILADSGFDGVYSHDFQEPKEDTICTKHQLNRETTVVQIISKNKINARLTQKNYLITRSKLNPKTRNKITNSQREQGSNI
jgi:hypothetical protein